MLLSNEGGTDLDYTLRIDGKYHSTLYIEGFSQMMKSPSYSYKFYWLEAIVNIISEGKEKTTFDEIIDEMISNAWYTVNEFHIHLSGIVMGEARDGIERAVVLLKKISDLPANASKTEIKNKIKIHNDELKEAKLQLTKMVPYRALAGFFEKGAEHPDWKSVNRLVSYIKAFDKNSIKLPYILGESGGLKKEVIFDPEWMRMIQDNTVPILGWIKYEKVCWLQNNNPEVPGLVYKLAPLDDKERKLSQVRNLWDAILETEQLSDVFTGNPIDKTQYDVDHFIPWSFVMNDELWNLMPMDSTLNPSKSNRLPKWDPFFAGFSKNQYMMYRQIHSKPEVHELFEKCYKNNMHSIWAERELYLQGHDYEEFRNILDKNMHPIYDSARRQGYEEWKWSGV